MLQRPALADKQPPQAHLGDFYLLGGGSRQLFNRRVLAPAPEGSADAWTNITAAACSCCGKPELNTPSLAWRTAVQVRLA